MVGWIVYRTLRRTDKAAVSDLATVIGAIGGAAVTGLFHSGRLFGFYAMGLAAGFFVYLLLALGPLKDVPFLGGD